MSFTAVNKGDKDVANLIQQIINALTGASAASAQAIKMTKLSDVNAWALQVANTEATKAQAFQVLQSDGTTNLLKCDVNGVTITGNISISGTATLGGSSLFANPMTTIGDIIYGGTSGVATRLAAGSSGFFLKSNGAAAPTWAAALADPMTTAGDVIIRNAVNATARLAVGTAGQVLTVDGGTLIPAWAAAPVAGGAVTLNTGGGPSAPPLTFTGRTTVGVYSPAASQVAMGVSTDVVVTAIGGATPYLDVTQQVRGFDGVEGTPGYGFRSATGTGFWRTAGDAITASIAGVQRLNFSNVGLKVSAGRVGTTTSGQDVNSPGFYFIESSGGKTGLYYAGDGGATNQLSVGISGATVGTFVTAGLNLDKSITAGPYLSVVQGVSGAPVTPDNRTDGAGSTGVGSGGAYSPIQGDVWVNAAGYEYAAVWGSAHGMSGTAGFIQGAKFGADIPASGTYTAGANSGSTGVDAYASAGKASCDIRGINAHAVSNVGATSSTATGIEINLETYAAVGKRYGLGIAATAGAFAATNPQDDMMIRLIAKASTAQWANGISFERAESGGLFPISTTGYLISANRSGAAAANLGKGLDWDNLMQFSTSSIEVPGFYVLYDAIHFNSPNIGIQTKTQFGTGVGVIGIGNAQAVPTTNPTGGGVMYSQSGAGKWRGAGGTITTFGPAEPHCPTCGRDFALEWESERFGALAVCVWCLTDGMTRGIIRRSETI